MTFTAYKQYNQKDDFMSLFNFIGDLIFGAPTHHSHSTQANFDMGGGFHSINKSTTDFNAVDNATSTNDNLHGDSAGVSFNDSFSDPFNNSMNDSFSDSFSDTFSDSFSNSFDDPF